MWKWSEKVKNFWFLRFGYTIKTWFLKNQDEVWNFQTHHWKSHVLEHLFAQRPVVRKFLDREVNCPPNEVWQKDSKWAGRTKFKILLNPLDDSLNLVEDIEARVNAKRYVCFDMGVFECVMRNLKVDPVQKSMRAENSRRNAQFSNTVFIKTDWDNFFFWNMEWRACDAIYMDIQIFSGMCCGGKFLAWLVSTTNGEQDG